MGSTFKAVITLNDAQIKALGTGSPLIVPHVNPGKVLIPISSTIVFNPWFADYTNIDMGSLLVGDYSLSASFPFFSGLAVDFSTNARFILAPGHTEITEYAYAAAMATNFMPIDLPALEGQPFGLVCTTASGALTGGDARNRLTVTLSFYVA